MNISNQASARLIKNGWTIWNGGACPVKPRTKVKIMLRNQAEAGMVDKHISHTPELYSSVHNGLPMDIVAYKLVQSIEDILG